MSEFSAEVVENKQYSMGSSYARNVADMNKKSEYPAWNAAADNQVRYPDAALQGEKVRKQVMK